MFGSQKFDWLHNPVKIEASRARVGKMRSRLRHRAKVCRHYKISVAEYERRFLDWRSLRKRYADHLKNQQQRAARDTFNMLLAARAEDRASRKRSREAAAEAASLIDGLGPQDGAPRLRAVFPADDDRP